MGITARAVSAPAGHVCLKPKVEAFFDSDTSTLTYIVCDPLTKDTIVIDPVWDYDPASSTLENKSYLKVKNFLLENQCQLHAVLETHAHADHVSGAQFFKKDFPNVKIGIGEHITEVQKIFKEVFHLPALVPNGQQFDLLLKEEEYTFGSLHLKVYHTPGHTPACCSYLFGDALFVGDALFMPDYGTGRCDFPGGSARNLYISISEKIYTLPLETRIFTGHDYMPGGRPLAYESTVLKEMTENIHLKKNTPEKEFVHFRETRDQTLKTPRLLLPSIQLNINAALLHPKESNGSVYLKIPLSLKQAEK